MSNRTLVICKPDAVERGLVGEILGRFERRGFRIVAAELRQVDGALASEHYAEHLGKDFYPQLLEFITRSPVFAFVLEGPAGSWEVVRHMMGKTNSLVAEPGTVRGDLSLDGRENLIHGSDGPESAMREIALWFPGLDAGPAAS